MQNTKQGAIRSADGVRFLRHVVQHVVGRVIVVLDNAGIHRAGLVEGFVQAQDRLSLVFLLPYVPELNPIERVWAYVKRNVLGNFCARWLAELRARLKVAWQRVRYVHLPARLVHSNLCRDQ